MSNIPFLDSIPIEFINSQNQIIRGNLFFDESARFENLIILSNSFNTPQTALIPWARYFCAHGMGVITFDFRGGSFDSESDGSFFEMSVLTETEDLNVVLKRCFDLFCAAKIWLIGISQGGLAAALAAAENPGVDGLVLFMPAFVIPDHGRALYGDKDHIPEYPQALGVPVGQRYYLDTMDLDVFRIIQAFYGPVLIFHGQDDPIVPVAYAQKAFEVYPHAWLNIYPGEGHMFSEKAWLECMEQTVNFIRLFQKDTNKELI